MPELYAKFIQPYLVTSNNYEPGFYRISAFANDISLSNTEWDKFNLAGFTCASKYAVEDRIAHGVPAWQSRYFGDWDTQRLYNGSGAYHGSDIPILFGSGEEVTGIPNSEVQDKYSRYMGATWVAFASDPHRGLEKVGWPAFNTSSKFYIIDYFMLDLIFDTMQGRSVLSLDWDTKMGRLPVFWIPLRLTKDVLL